MARKKAETTINEEVIDSRLGVYEVGYLMVPTIAEEGLGAEVTALKDLLSNNGAVFISEEYPKLIELAYQMVRSISNRKQKFTTAYFGWVKFECSSLQAKEIKNLLDKNEKLVRFLLIKTVRENTMSVKRTYSKPEGTKRKVSTPKSSEVQTEGETAVVEEVLDKEIDALVL